jgi:hypothetical protein
MDSRDTHFQNQSRPALVRDDEIAAATQHKEWKRTRVAKLQTIVNILLTECFGEIACRTTHFERRVGCEGDVFLDVHLCPRYSMI